MVDVDGHAMLSSDENYHDLAAEIDETSEGSE